ncbi:MAG: lactoylglutathione lyase, partial [Methylobacteriaceae bacterium]|nr:lactoylglutathione lyase [Methylobacteriaceae bacterium]
GTRDDRSERGSSLERLCIRQGMASGSAAVARRMQLSKRGRDRPAVADWGGDELEGLRFRAGLWEPSVEYLHTMIRVSDLDQSLDFLVNKFGLVEVRRVDNEKARYTLVFLAAPDDVERAKETKAPLVELTHNWDPEIYSGGRNFGHLAYRVDDIYALCKKLMDQGVTINRPPRDGNMAFIRTPDGISIELLQKGNPKPPQEPWASMPNTGTW